MNRFPSSLEGTQPRRDRIEAKASGTFGYISRMSEFSNSLHLVATDQQDGVDLLRASEISGWVFPPTNGWVTIVVDEDMLIPAPPDVVAANRGLLLDYLNAVDHGWMFRLFRGPAQLQGYECSWEDAVEANTDGLDLPGLVETLSVATGRDLDAAYLRTLLFVERFDDILPDYPGGNPGHEFAATVGLTHFEWLSGHYMRLPDAPTVAGTVYVDRPTGTA